MGRDRKDSLSSDDSLSKSDSLSSSEERQDNKNDRNNKQRSSSESLSSDDRNKSKKDKKSKSSKDSKKDKEKEKKKEDKSKKSKKKISKEDKKDKKKKHKSGKDKKSKKEKKNKKDPKKYVQQPTSKASKRFGKYGIINKEHAYEKRDEFQQWLADVKKLNIEALTQNEERRLFDDFIEDYNTASMPEQKYYDLVLWEQYLQSKQIGKKVKTNEEVGLDDEALKKLEREKQRQAFETQATAAALNQIYTQGNMASEIQETEAKRALMQQSYKIGDIEKALDIQKELVPEKKKPGQQG